MVYTALLPLMRTPRLPVVDWTEAPADLNGLVCFAERRNLVSARVTSHFKRSLLSLGKSIFFDKFLRPLTPFQRFFYRAVELPASRRLRRYELGVRGFVCRHCRCVFAADYLRVGSCSDLPTLQ